jgi:hypothetical protein
MKVDIGHTLAAPVDHHGPLLVVGFARSEWEIMYPLFVAEGLIDTSTRVNRKDT